MAMSENTFEGRPIRMDYDTEREEWLFSVVDVCGILSGSGNPRKYWSVLKTRLKAEGDQTATLCSQLKMLAPDGKMRDTDVLNAEGITAIAKRIRNSHYTEAFIEWLERFDGRSKRYVLKHKDVDVLEIELGDHGMISSLGKVLNEKHLPIGTARGNGADAAAVKDWWDGRSIPASREGLRALLDTLGMVSPHQLLDKSFGLSLSDQYWICPQNGDLKWEDVNFFHNAFSDDVGNMLFGKARPKSKDAPRLLSPDNTSDGVLKKKWKIINGKRCLIKGGTLPNNQEVANEVLASRICERLGIPYVNYDLIGIGGIKYCVCEDFITGDTELVTAWHIKNLIKSDDDTSDHDAFISKAEELGIKDARRRIDMMIVLDFIIVNTDRHYNNFGLVRNANTLEWMSVAPIYDSGTSMWCKEFPNRMDAEDLRIESKPFRNNHISQIKLVKDLSWLNLGALDGIEKEYERILKASVPDPSEIEARSKKLCSELRRRIGFLGTLIKNGFDV